MVTIVNIIIKVIIIKIITIIAVTGIIIINHHHKLFLYSFICSYYLFLLLANHSLIQKKV